MADTVVIRCTGCALDIVARDGEYQVMGLHYHPECYDRKMAEVLSNFNRAWDIPAVHWVAETDSLSNKNITITSS